MPKIRNKQELDKFMNMAGQDIMREMVDEIKSYLTDFVQKNLYDAYTPSNYVRTFEFINAISGKVNVTSKGITGIVYFDTEMIHAFKTPDGEWNQHMGTLGQEGGKWLNQPFDGEDFIKQMEEYGRYTGDNNSLQGIHMIRETKRALEDGELAEVLMAAARRKGYVLVIF